MTRSSIKQYQQTNLSQVENADPHTLISLIMQHIERTIELGAGGGKRGEMKSIDQAYIMGYNKDLVVA